MVKPAKAAYQLTHLWRTICPDELYPVDCRLLAKALNIKVVGASIDDNFEAQLRIRLDKGVQKKAIIYNDNIREEGRINFCIAHELGHNSCHVDQEEFFCSSKDLNDMDPHPLNIEQEANAFAATLLMPGDDFRSQIDRQPISLTTLSRLADERYKTSLTATCFRLIELSPTKHYGMVVLQNNKVKWWKRSDAMRWTGFSFKSKQSISAESVGRHNSNPQRIDSNVWLNEKNASRWELTQSTVHMPYYDQTLVLITAISTENYSESEESTEINTTTFLT